MATYLKCAFMCLAVCCLWKVVRTEMFTALVELQKVLNVELDIANDIRQYIKLEEGRLARLKDIANDYEEHSNTALKNPTQYLSNPLNAFLLVKRFTTDWDRVENLIRNNTADVIMSRIQARSAGFPNQEDLTGAASALLRLQDTYALPTYKIALGELQGIKQSPQLSANDCFELGRVAYNDADYYHTVLWMEEAIERLSNDISTPEMLGFKANLLDYLAYSISMQGNSRGAYNYTLQWLDIEPDHVRAQNNKLFYEQQMLIEEQERVKGDDGEPPKSFQNKRILDDYRSSEEFQTYEALCRGEKIIKYEFEHLLSCQFRRHEPIYYIRPLKEEIVYFDPLIVVYHDLLTDAEMDVIKNTAAPRLQRSGVFSLVKDGMTRKTSQFRTSKSAWLHDWEHPLIKQVSTKVRYMANLTLDTAEELQVVNYGIGGHYEPHFDFARKDEKGGFDPAGGNRIATAIFYMTDVTAGGYTVFTQLGVRVPPEKGSCAFWYNLRQSGEGDFNTRHAGCPVLTGTKWVANKWIHERGQEFIRPCDIDPLK